MISPVLSTRETGDTDGDCGWFDESRDFPLGNALTDFRLLTSSVFDDSLCKRVSADFVMHGAYAIVAFSGSE